MEKNHPTQTIRKKTLGSCWRCTRIANNEEMTGLIIHTGQIVCLLKNAVLVDFMLFANLTHAASTIHKMAKGGGGAAALYF